MTISASSEVKQGTLGKTHYSTDGTKLKIKSNDHEYILSFKSKDDLNEVFNNMDDYFNDMAKPKIAKSVYPKWQATLEIDGTLPEGTQIKAADGQKDHINFKADQKHLTLDTGDKRDAIYTNGNALDSSTIFTGEGHDAFNGTMTGFGAIFMGEDNDFLALENSQVLMADLGGQDTKPTLKEQFSGYGNHMRLKNSKVMVAKAGFNTNVILRNNSNVDMIIGKKVDIAITTDSSFRVRDENTQIKINNIPE